MIMRAIWTYLLALTLFTLTLFPCGASANLGNVLRFTVKPEKPESGVPVTINLFSYQTDLGLAHIIWYKNGEAVQDKVAGTTFQFTNGTPGETTTIDVVAVLPGGTTYREQMTFRPVDVDLLWEADTYTPPFYKGKALPTHESSIRVAAYPFEGTSTHPGVFSFTWAYGTAEDTIRGLGQNSITMLGTWARSKSSVAVTVEDVSGAAGAKKVLDVYSTNPIIRFYKKDPLAGVLWNKALRSISVSDNDVIVRAAPYFFSNTDIDRGNILFRWFWNNTPSTNWNNVEAHITRSDGSGQAVLKMDNANRVIQEAGGSVGVLFQ